MSETIPSCLKNGLAARICELSTPMQPQPTTVVAGVTRLVGVRAVLFDVYGTLFISASGDVGTAAAMDNASALNRVLLEMKLSREPACAASRGVELLFAHIEQEHAQRRAGGIAHPEVDIRRIWKGVFTALLHEGLIADVPAEKELLHFAVEYECRVNPVWPMPGAEELLKVMRGKDLRLGIVSNAQFFTPILFDALFQNSPEGIGFDPSLCCWSYEMLEAKPSVNLFRRPLEVLNRGHGIEAHEALYVGNDMRNDIRPAAECGCRTALFAGDRRSLRMREDDADCAEVVPDLVLTELAQVADAVA